MAAKFGIFIMLKPSTSIAYVDAATAKLFYLTTLDIFINISILNGNDFACVESAITIYQINRL